MECVDSVSRAVGGGHRRDLQTGRVRDSHSCHELDAWVLSLLVTDMIMTGETTTSTGQSHSTDHHGAYNLLVITK